MRRSLLVTALALAALAGAAPAAQAAASVDFAVDSPSMQLAKDLARTHWGVDACNGQVALSWTPLAPLVNATASWTNPKTAYDHPELNGGCRIAFNTTMDFDWAKFCTVVVHEFGHLAGHAHVDSGSDVMSPIYYEPLPACISGAPRSAQPSEDETHLDEEGSDEEDEGRSQRKGKRWHKAKRGKRWARKRWMRSRQGFRGRAARYYRARG
jgi:hypothetical protein